MRSWSPEQIALASGAQLVVSGANGSGPERAVIDSREAGPGTLFVGLRGAKLDGGAFARQALGAGAWGALVAPEHAAALVAPGYAQTASAGAAGVLLAAEDPLRALQHLATAWRRALGAKVIGVTGSTGKTTTKDLLGAVIAPQRRTVTSRANFNTEIGLPLEILSAPADTEVLVLEMAMRGSGQITELAQLADPDVGVIVSIGPVHLELLETVEAIAAAKAELLAALPAGATAVVPAGEPLLEPHLRADLRTITFGEGGDVRLLSADGERLAIDLDGERISLEVSFEQAHLRRNLLAALAAASAVGVRPSGRVELALASGRGRRTELADGVLLIDDCYNANPMSMRAALEDLALTAERTGHRRKVAVLGDMLELGSSAREFHAEVGGFARARGVDVLVTVGPLAAAMADRFGGAVHSVGDATQAAELVPTLLEPGDAVLVKGSRGVGLELVCQALAGAPGTAGKTQQDGAAG